jgi:hypothetical protein
MDVGGGCGWRSKIARALPIAEGGGSVVDGTATEVEAGGHEGGGSRGLDWLSRSR